MSIIYIFKGEYERGDAGFAVIAKLASLYMSENDIGERCPTHFDAGDIRRDANGKPFFSQESLKGKELFFSLSHSGEFWMCMFSESPCGLDCQEMKDTDYMKIAGRFFTLREQAEAENGKGAFYRIWTRREALGKLIGKGFFTEGLPDLDSDIIEYAGKKYRFTEIRFDDSFCATACTEGEDKPEIVMEELEKWL